MRLLKGLLLGSLLCAQAPGIYSVVGYAPGNVLSVITGRSVVVIDTTEWMVAARQTFDEFRKVSQLPVSYAQGGFPEELRVTLPRDQPDRPVVGWAESLDWIRKLGGSAALVGRARAAIGEGNSQLVAVNRVVRNIYRTTAFQLATPKPTVRPVVALSNGKVKLEIDKLGGSLTRFEWVDQGLNPLVWANAGPVDEARAMGHFICLDRWGQPSKAEEKNGMPFHGEATRVEWTVESQNASFARMSAKLPMAQISIRRYVRLNASEPVAVVMETVTNDNKLTRPFNMVQHATVGPPFLDENVLVDSNAGKGFPQVDPDGTTFSWPQAMKEGKPVDMRRLKDDPDPNVVSYVIDEPIGWATAANPGKGLLIGYLWKTADYPWLNFWRHVQDGKPLARGLEFGTTGLHQPFPVLLDKGRMLGRRLFGILDAGESQTRSYAAFLVKIPADFTGTARIRYSGGQILLQEMGPRARIFMLNVGPSILEAADR